MNRIVAVIAAVAMLMLSACNPTGPTTADSTSADWTPVAGMPLEEPDQVFRNDAGVLEVTLTASTETIDVSGSPLGARPFTASAGGQTFPAKLNAPTLHVRPGDTIRMTIVNRLGNGTLTNIHYHGLHVTPLGTGDNIFREFADGQTYQSEVQVPTNHTRGMFWYHVHHHGNSQGQVMGGMSGLLIIEGIEELLPQGGSGVSRERQLALRDVQTSGGSIITNSEPHRPSIRLVNGLYQPTFSMQSGQYELWRLANIGSDVFYRIQFENHDFNIIAEDGFPVWEVTSEKELLIPPGKRFDVLVVGGTPGEYHLQSLPYAQEATEDGNLTPIPIPQDSENLATVTVTAPTGPAAPAVPLPTSLMPEEDISDDPIVKRETPFVFGYLYDEQGNLRAGTINGVAFTADMAPSFSPVLGTIEEWTLQNSTTDDHPFHIHVNDFQVLSVNGQPYDAHGHQDVVVIPKQYENESGQVVNGEVVVRIKFTDFAGWFVYHCHILQHEDAGMMATVQVRANATDPITPPPTGVAVRHA
ncbi:MAG: multicopper oxidase family protein [Egibacteraceae bacterium]